MSLSPVKLISLPSLSFYHFSSSLTVSLFSFTTTTCLYRNITFIIILAQELEFFVKFLNAVRRVIAWKNTEVRQLVLAMVYKSEDAMIGIAWTAARVFEDSVRRKEVPIRLLFPRVKIFVSLRVPW